jgi:hypothetical protein
MTTINDLDQINAEAMMTLSEIGVARYERFLGKTLASFKGSQARIKLKSFISDWAHRERELELRIKVAPMYKPMA